MLQALYLPGDELVGCEDDEGAEKIKGGVDEGGDEREGAGLQGGDTFGDEEKDVGYYIDLMAFN